MAPPDDSDDRGGAAGAAPPPPPPPPPFALTSPRRAGGWARLSTAPPLEEMAGRVKVPGAGSSRLSRCSAWLGPAILVSVGYVDPGNWATNIAAGAAFGYAHLFIVLVSCCIAIFLQTRAVRLGIGSGRDLAQACRDAYPQPVGVGLWLTAEVAIVSAHSRVGRRRLQPRGCSWLQPRGCSPAAAAAGLLVAPVGGSLVVAPVSSCALTHLALALPPRPAPSIAHLAPVNCRWPPTSPR